MTNTPTPDKRPDVAAMKARLLDACVGKPAKVPWPHRLLHDAVDAIEALEARQEKLEAVVEAAREWRQSLEGDGWAKDVIEHGAARPGMGKLMKALADLGEGDG